jgi:type IV secretory pathway VirB4 component
MAGQQKSDFGNSLDLVDIQEIKENAVVMKDGSLRQIVMVGGVNFALKSDTEQNIITQGYQNFLNSVDFPLQIVVHSRKVNIEKYIEGLTKRKEEEETALLKNQIDEYVEFIKGFVQKNAIMEKTFLVVVPFYPVSGMGTAGKSLFSSLPFFGGSKDSNKAAAAKVENEKRGAEDFREDMAQLSQRTGQVMSALLNIGLEAAILENDALIELFYNFYNPRTIERENVTVPNSDAQSR